MAGLVAFVLFLLRLEGFHIHSDPGRVVTAGDAIGRLARWLVVWCWWREEAAGGVLLSSSLLPLVRRWMVIMAGMLPGVECARRRRVRQGGSSAAGAAEAPGGTRRPSFCLHTGGHDHAHLGSAAASKERSSVCKETMMARAWTLDSNVREAKERLDQKLRGQRETAVIIKRHHSVGTVRPPTAKPHARSTSSGNNLHHPATTAAECAVQREVLSKRPPTSAGGARRRRFSWSRLGRCGSPPPASAESSEAWECAVCLDELRAGDVVAHLPCAHRFHWSCAVPWVRAASRCPVCRARVHLAATS